MFPRRVEAMNRKLIVVNPAEAQACSLLRRRQCRLGPSCARGTGL